MKRLVIVGAGGRLGAALVREYAGFFHVVGFNHAQLDLGKPEHVRATLGGLEFDTLINTAAQTNVDRCETHQEEAFALNAEAPKVLAEICGKNQARFIHISTDYVFDGEKREPYTEEDEARPISVYGESKRAGEENVLAVQDRSASAKTTMDRHLVVRVSWVFGPERPSFIDAMIKRAREEEHIDAVADKFSTPTFTHDIAEMVSRFFDVDVPGGILHFANNGECSWQEYAQYALDCCRASGISLKAKTVGPAKIADMKSWIARRPVYSVLSTAKYAKLTSLTPRSWRDAVSDYIERSYSKK